MQNSWLNRIVPYPNAQIIEKEYLHLFKRHYTRIKVLITATLHKISLYIK